MNITLLPQTGNHDRGRIADLKGPGFVNAFNTLLLLLPGTPTTYQGEELGMRNILPSFDDAQDPRGKEYGPVRTTTIHSNTWRVAGQVKS